MINFIACYVHSFSFGDEFSWCVQKVSNLVLGRVYLASKISSQILTKLHYLFSNYPSHFCYFYRSLKLLIVSPYRISSSYDRASWKQATINPTLSDSDHLLLHSFKKSQMIPCHLIKFINAADTLVSHYHRPSFKHPFSMVYTCREPSLCGLASGNTYRTICHFLCKV